MRRAILFILWALVAGCSSREEFSQVWQVDDLRLTLIGKSKSEVLEKLGAPVCKETPSYEDTEEEATRKAKDKRDQEFEDEMEDKRAHNEDLQRQLETLEAGGSMELEKLVEKREEIIRKNKRTERDFRQRKDELQAKLKRMKEGPDEYWTYDKRILGDDHKEHAQLLIFFKLGTVVSMMPGKEK